MEITTIRTTAKNKDFLNLVTDLDAYLKVTDKDEHDFYNQFNNIDVLNNIVVIYVDTVAVGCAAFKPHTNAAVEVKRMYVAAENRGTGVAQILLKAIENWAQELTYKKCFLETGIRQIAAVKFYKKNNYKVIPNYGQYKGMANSICFEKEI